ncbi:Ditrans,polycis-undecaprenyl-diphosphate synthase ((2E,6E)-farnesyl-diphosphate specific) [Tepidimonas alkaliphilus]|uniref:Isoprenyl transferase n=1 Tax=Tepidimonas alkaliphilus TaxID=2588942 RepID=A0A554WA86_9BURK|nr:polyprenyl diphosphate synthase [Tepidimonas alkaliphilus]TSE20489.1 Ditrans,polycis-undecaprenyl-diphosphate synthase ((2E,6E)-farnesyl-diphosphate specific) [Tepidimonas alkaliphilus]
MAGDRNASLPPRVHGVPVHVAIVMDGNGRWARQRLLPRAAGHRAGMEALRRIVAHAARRGVAVLTVFAFSSENWARPPEEVQGILRLLAQALIDEVPRLHEAGVALHVVGARDGLDPQLVQGIEEAQRRTVGNTRLVLNVCFNYGGRWDIVQAAQRLAARGEPINEASLSAALALAHVPDPDLVIRTGGEQRISNFVLWQLAYSELFFTDCLWPAFDEAEFDRALQAYAGRQRRFGRTPEQALSATVAA